MKPQPDSTTEILKGLVEQVIFHNAESGICVLRVTARGYRDLVTPIGCAAMISAGEWITASGIRFDDRKHAPRFKAHLLKTSAPSTVDGLEKNLGSGMIRGIGPVCETQVVKVFGKCERMHRPAATRKRRLREEPFTLYPGMAYPGTARCRAGFAGDRKSADQISLSEISLGSWRPRISRASRSVSDGVITFTSGESG